MSDNRSRVHEVCAILLRYPDESLIALLPEVRAAVHGLPDDVSAGLQRFLAWLESTTLLDAQRHYVETFDLRRQCSPYLTYWTFGDTRNRGAALLRFKQVYREAGLTIDESELPDHLAVVLEFACDGDPRLGNALLAEHRAVITLLHRALVDVDSPYAYIVAGVVETTPELTASDEALMARLATSGPPAEAVGMAGPVDLALPTYAATQNAEIGARR